MPTSPRRLLLPAIPAFLGAAFLLASPCPGSARALPAPASAPSAAAGFDSAAAVPKTLAFEFAPVPHPDNNARIWWSFNQAFGWASVRLGEAGADGHWAGRAGQFLGLAYLNLAIGHYTHELGHETHRRGWSLDIADWGRPWPWPRFVPGRLPGGTRLRNEDWIKNIAGGLNQEETDAYHAFRMSLGSMAFDESMAFSFRKLSGVTYDLYTGRAFGYEYPGVVGDVENYSSRLRSRGIRLTGAEFAWQAALSDVLTWRLWEAWWGTWRYLRHGERERANTAWRAGGWTVLPPLVNWYLTPDGGFYDVSVFARPPGPGVLEARFGRDADFMGGGKVDRVRIGAGYALELPLGRALRGRAAPSAHATLRRSDFGPTGWIAGLETALLAFDRAGLSLRLEYGRDDLVEHVAKWKGGGFRLASGFGYRL